MTVEYMRSIAERYKRLGYPVYRWFEAGDAPPWRALATSAPNCAWAKWPRAGPTSTWGGGMG